MFKMKVHVLAFGTCKSEHVATLVLYYDVHIHIENGDLGRWEKYH